MINELQKLHQAHTLITANPCEAVFKTATFHVTLQYNFLADALHKTKVYACYELLNLSERCLLLVERTQHKIKFASPPALNFFIDSLLGEEQIESALGITLDISQKRIYKNMVLWKGGCTPAFLADIKVYPLDDWDLQLSILEIKWKH